MGYTPEMKELIKRVEATRPERIERTRRGEYFTPMTLDQRGDVLGKFHPDYMEAGRRAVKLGTISRVGGRVILWHVVAIGLAWATAEVRNKLWGIGLGNAG